MAELVAQGPNPNESWRQNLREGASTTLGRANARSTWAASWDKQISGLHATLTWKDGKLCVSKDPQARNKIFYKGLANDNFTLLPGEQFVIGQTTFSLEDNTISDLPEPFNEMTFSPEELQQFPYSDANERIEVLAALPGVIRNSPSEQELGERVLDVLIRGIPRSEAAAIVRLNFEDAAGAPEVEVPVVRNKKKGREEFRPSRRLVFDAIQRRRQSVMNIWPMGGKPSVNEATLSPGLDWALCVPLADDPAPGWGLYVAGRLESHQPSPGPTQQNLLKSDLKFAELVAEIFGSLRQVLDLQRRHGMLARFLSRPVLAAIAHKDMEEVLKPRETEVTVLFCDIRGSCHIAEKGQFELTALWNRVSEALNIMASSIIDQDGVIGDFQGDAAMGFWGWPLACDDAVERAARAALTIRRRFAHAALQKGNALAGFTSGIGIATGPAIAGKLGTADQFKVDVFGPTVNLASRLEGMTKLFKVPILLDDRSAAQLNQSTNSHWARCRRLAKIQPYGMQTTVLTVSELLPPAVEPATLSERARKDYEAALDAFQEGRWEDAGTLLCRLPPDDGAGEFIKTFMADRQQTPPAGWNGVVVLGSK